jgi:hypothetical protein
VAGFVEGEGSFNVPIRRERDRAMPLRVGLSSMSHKSDTSSRSFFGGCSVAGQWEHDQTASSTTRSLDLAT